MATKQDRGFTLIELLLAIAFLAFMLLFVIGATVQLLRTYNKGVAIKQINQSGRAVTDQIARDIVSGRPITYVGPADRLCMLQAAYIWNPTSGPPLNKYASGPKPIQLIRTTDANMCVSNPVATPTFNCKIGAVFYICPTVAKSAELLTSSPSSLDFRIGVRQFNYQSSTNQQLYQFQIQLSTLDSNTPTDFDPILGQFVCAGGTAGDFCATSSFKTTVYAAGG